MPHEDSEGDAGSRILKVLFPLFFFLAGLFFLYGAASEAMKVRASRAWTPTAAVVESNETIQGPSFDDGAEVRVYFRYVVKRQTYRLLLRRGEALIGGDLGEIRYRYPVGKEVTIYVDPADPESALIERRLSPGRWSALGAGIVFIALAGVLVRWMRA